MSLSRRGNPPGTLPFKKSLADKYEEIRDKGEFPSSNPINTEPITPKEPEEEGFQDADDSTETSEEEGFQDAEDSTETSDDSTETSEDSTETSDDDSFKGEVFYP